MKENSTSGIGITTIVFVVFLTLKLLNLEPVSNWSWWWVTSPIWIPICLVLLFIIIASIVVAATTKK